MRAGLLSDREPVRGVEEQPVFQWVSERRFPLFFGTELDFEYRLCVRLCTATPTQDGPPGDRRGITVHPELLRVQLRSYEGFKKFQRFLASRPGGISLQFCLDVAQCTDPDLSPQERDRRLRGVKERYLREGAPLVLDGEAKHLLGDPTILSVARVQKLLEDDLRSYWVPRFLLHQ